MSLCTIFLVERKSVDELLVLKLKFLISLWHHDRRVYGVSSNIQLFFWKYRDFSKIWYSTKNAELAFVTQVSKHQKHDLTRHCYTLSIFGIVLSVALLDLWEVFIIQLRFWFWHLSERKNTKTSSEVHYCFCLVYTTFSINQSDLGLYLSFILGRFKFRRKTLSHETYKTKTTNNTDHAFLKFHYTTGWKS